MNPSTSGLRVVWTTWHGKGAKARDALSVGPIPYLVIEINRKIIKRTAYCHISVFKNGFIMMMMVEHREISQAVDNNILPNLCRS